MLEIVNVDELSDEEYNSMNTYEVEIISRRKFYVKSYDEQDAEDLIMNKYFDPAMLKDKFSATTSLYECD